MNGDFDSTLAAILSWSCTVFTCLPIIVIASLIDNPMAALIGFSMLVGVLTTQIFYVILLLWNLYE